MKIKLSEILQDTRPLRSPGHIRPDGDCVGSCIGLYLYYSRNFRCQPTVYLEETVILLSFWKEATGSYIPVRKRKYTICSLHWMAGDKQRLGASAKYFDTAKRTVCIDHHISNPGYAQSNYIEAEASSTCELIYDILEKIRSAKYRRGSL